MKSERGEMSIGLIVTIISLASIILIALLMFVLPLWNVWKSGLGGEADLKRAEQTRMIQIQQAKGEKEAATLRAEAIAIVGKAAKEFPEYRQQEFIGSFAEAMHNGKIHQIIYVPTEANIPITEAKRLK